MGTDKKPYDGVALHDSDGAVIVRYSCRPAHTYFLESNERVMRIGQPKLVLFNSQFLNRRWQAIVAVPKTPNRPTFHRAEKVCSARRDIQPGPSASPNQARQSGHLPRSACPTHRQSDPESIREDEKILARKLLDGGLDLLERAHESTLSALPEKTKTREGTFAAPNEKTC
jgi:hypothetical protein